MSVKNIDPLKMAGEYNHEQTPTKEQLEVQEAYQK